MRSKYGRLLLVGALMLISGLLATAVRPQASGYSLRFYGNGTGDIDRVKIPVDPPTSADIGGSFTIEFFIRVLAGENGNGACTTGDAGWTNGNTIVDRDIFGPGDFGDYGISLFGLNGVIAFGVSDGAGGATICGTRNVVDGNWHHIAVTRNSATGALALFVDGVPDGTATGPTGDISYRDGRATTWPNDPFLVLGAEKHDFSPLFPSYSGWFEELRISTNIRYTGAFTPPTEPFGTDANTALLYHFDEGTGNQITDTSGNGTNGVRQPGGTPTGPEWSTLTPFTSLPPPTNTPIPPPTDTPVPAPTNTPVPAPTDTPVPAPTDTPVPAPTDTPVPAPTDTPVPAPTDTPVPAPTDTPIPAPTDTPIPAPTDTPIPAPTDTPVPAPTDTPVPPPTNTPVPAPTNTPIPAPTNTPIPAPTNTLVTLPVYSSNPAPGGIITISGQPGQVTFGTLQITNSGGGILTISAITLTGSPQISLISSSSFSVGAGVTQVASIQCASPVAGVFTSVMQVFHSASGSVATYSVICNIGVTQALVTATPIGFVASPTPLPPGAPTLPPPAVPPTGSVVEVRGLAIRTGPYLNATLIGVARPGTTYTVLARNQDEGAFTWYLIVFGGNRQGWVSGRYLRISGTESLAPFAGSIFDQIDDAPDVGVRATTRAMIDLRPRPTGRIQRTATIPAGVELIVVGRTVQNGGTFWLHVRYGDLIGWIPAAPVTLQGDVSLLPIR
jgi:hypothetical protein